MTHGGHCMASPLHYRSRALSATRIWKRSTRTEKIVAVKPTKMETVNVESDVKRLIRYQNYAEELRAISGDRINPQDYDGLQRIAADYDRLAVSLAAVIKSRELAERGR
jgi:hypothetical protein